MIASRLRRLGCELLNSARSDAARVAAARASERLHVGLALVFAWRLFATYMLFVEPPPPRKIVIASGGQNGAYFRYAQKYARNCKRKDYSSRSARPRGR